MIDIGIFVFPEVEELDFVGPFEVFSAANSVAPGSVSVKLVAFEDGPLTAANGMRFLPDITPERSSQEVLVIPGGQGRRVAMRDPRVKRFVAEQYERVKFLGTVCTGAFIAAEAGLLRNMAATTHHRYFEELDAYPGVKVVRRRVVKHGRILTAGGVSSGIELSLCIHALLFGGDLAKAAADYVEYPFRSDMCVEY